MAKVFTKIMTRAVMMLLLMLLTATTAWADVDLLITSYTATAGTTGANNNEGYAKLVDNNKTTKWCVDMNKNSSVFIEFQFKGTVMDDSGMLYDDDADRNGKCGKSVTYNLYLDKHLLVISGNGDMADYEDADTPWEPYKNEIYNIEVKEGVTGIGSYTFRYYDNLQGVKLPNSLKTISEEAFYCNPAIKEITIPAGVTRIDDFAFYDCSNLATIEGCTGLTSIGTYVFGRTKWYNNQMGGMVYIGNIAYGYKGEMLPNTEVTIKDGTTIIAPYCFLSKEDMASVTIPNSVTIIGEEAFAGCTKMESITIPAGVTSIGADAFNDCTVLKNVYCYADPTKLTWAVGDLSPASSFAPSKATKFHVKAAHLATYKQKFGDLNVTFVGNLDNPDGGDDDELKDDSGSCGTGVTYKYVSSSQTIIISGKGAMRDYSGIDEERPWDGYLDKISTVIVEDGVTVINNYAFDECENLANISIGKDVETIGDYAFFGCKKVTSITIPDNVTTIGDDAFENCSSLESVHIGSGVKYIGSYAFNNDKKLETITGFEGLQNAGAYAFGSSKEATPWWKKQDNGMVYINTVAYTYKGGVPANSEITIKDGTQSIARACFNGETGLKSINLPNTLTYIGSGAFDSCNGLESVIIPNSVETIDERAFQYCDNLKTVTIGSGVTTINEAAFFLCDKVTDVYCYADPEKLTWNGDFYNEFKYTTKFHVDDAAAWKEKFPNLNVVFIEMVPEQTLMDGDVLTGEIDALTFIKIAEGATVTLRNFTIDRTKMTASYSPCPCAGITCLGNATIILEGENFVKSLDQAYPAIQAGPEGTTLTIKGSGYLSAQSFGNSTGIGGANQQDCGDIVIESGNILAVGDMVGAGIGNGDNGSCGNITISGGTVEAWGGMGAASIGCAYQGSCGNITITNGITKVTARYSAMAKEYIGKSVTGTCGTITIGSNLEKAVASIWDDSYKTDIDYLVIQPKSNAIEGINFSNTTDGAWYTLTGMQLEGEPTAPGIYVKDGKRIAIR